MVRLIRDRLLEGGAQQGVFVGAQAAEEEEATQEELLNRQLPAGRSRRGDAIALRKGPLELPMVETTRDVISSWRSNTLDDPSARSYLSAQTLAPESVSTRRALTRTEFPDRRTLPSKAYRASASIDVRTRKVWNRDKAVPMSSVRPRARPALSSSLPSLVNGWSATT